ncbi:MAG: hypothetical protein H3C64_04785 [Candidatus Kuenenia stuttgartiensis]|nr:hypothetical protein [Candidatus Kuenenia stuttgartiensis]
MEWKSEERRASFRRESCFSATGNKFELEETTGITLQETQWQSAMLQLEPQSSLWC